MAIKTVRAQINGQWYILTPKDGKYEATVNAPVVTSWSQPDHKYNVVIEATNDAGTVTTADGTQIPELKLRVLEKIKPVVTIISPSDGAFIGSNTPSVVFTATDEVNGSGVSTGTLVVKLDGAPVPAGQITNEPITNGFKFTYTPGAPLGDGEHTITVDISDNDGNAADQRETSFTVDTVPPSLNITSPTDNLVTASKTLVVAGSTNDNTGSPVVISIKLGGVDQGAVSIGPDGSFSKQITLSEGANVITITATDAAGRSSEVIRNVTLDTSVPQIVSATLTPNPVDAGKTMVISVVIR